PSSETLTHPFRKPSSPRTFTSHAIPYENFGRSSHQLSRRPTGHDSDRIEGVHGLAVLIVERPFDTDDALRLGSRRNQLDDFSLQMNGVSGSHRLQPAQIVDARPQQRMRAKRPGFRSKPHRDRGGMPSRSSKPPEDGVLRRLFVQMKWLRVEFG